MRHLHLDFETYCELDITKVGMDVYCRHPSFEVLLAAWAVDDGPIYLEDYTQPRQVTMEKYLPPEVLKADVLIHAFNAAFERYVLRFGFGLDLLPSRFRCTMYHIWHLGFSDGLDDVGKQIPLAQDQQKLKEGKRLLHKFTKPAPRNHLVDRYDAENAPEDWQKFKHYCIQDVVAEREVGLFASRYPLSDAEQAVWELDQRINDRGLPVDERLVDAALQVYHDEKKHLNQKLAELTQLENPNSRDQLLGWLQAHECWIPNLQKDTIIDWLAHNATDDAVTRALRLRQQSARTAGAKWETYKRATDWLTERHRHAFQAYGAQRTGRFSGRNLQPHNLHSSPEDQDTKIRALLTGRRSVVAMRYGNVMDVVASCIRGGVTASHDRKLVVADYHSIENVVLGYLSGCEYINRINEEGRDPYKDFATHVFHLPYDQVEKAQRKFCKPPVLGCGYQLSGPTLVDYAAPMGVELTLKEAFKLVRIWRSLCHEVPSMWRWLVDATRHVVLGGEPVEGYGVRVWRDEAFLFITLLSGRSLAYYRPGLRRQTIQTVDEDGNPKSFETTSITYMGRNTKNHQWENLSTHGGKLTENIVQALSRDVLVHGLQRAEQKKLSIVGHVHDEIICEEVAEVSEKALEILKGVMSEPLPWAPGLKIGAEGYVAERYRKE